MGFRRIGFADGHAEAHGHLRRTDRRFRYLVCGRDDPRRVDQSAGILAAQILAVGDNALKAKIVDFKESLKKKIVDANNELAKVKYDYKTN